MTCVQVSGYRIGVQGGFSLVSYQGTQAMVGQLGPIAYNNSTNTIPIHTRNEIQLWLDIVATHIHYPDTPIT